VLWFSHTAATRTPTSTTDYGWQIVSVSQRKSDCDTEGSKERSRALAGGSGPEWVRELPGDTVTHRRRDGSAELFDRYICLPDTVDPRGVKGK